MEMLKERILNDGKVLGSEILKVDNFLNHQIDVALFNEMGKEFKRRFAEKKITKILTIESSGIAVACIAAQYFSVPVVFAKKQTSSITDEDVYSCDIYSFTKDKSFNVRVSRQYLSPEDRILIIDDFLANGNAVKGLINIANQAGSIVEGVGIVIEKAFQDGRKKIEELGVPLESLAIIDSIRGGRVFIR